jgi:predicted amidohydrolase
MMQIALIQICSSLDPKENVDKINYYIQESKKRDDIKAVFLPEVFYSMSDGTKPTPYLIDGENEHFEVIRNIAKDNKVALIGGTAATKLGDTVINRTYNFDRDGNELTQYDKMHLFAVNLSGTSSNTVINESDVYHEGHLPKVLDFNDWKIGLGICFDLRFPELYRYYFQKGAEIMTVSSAFTVPTGKAHWETLVRARAIENQSYVVAVDQWGYHNQKIQTFGHSMLVDPWGEVILNLGEGEGYAISELSKEKINKYRTRMNVNPRDYFSMDFN